MNTTTTRLLFVAVCLCAISALPVVDDNEPHSGADFIRNLFGITDLQQHVKVPDTYTPPVDGIHDGKVSMDFRPLKNRCFKFGSGDSLLTWEEAGKNPHLGMDGRCFNSTYLTEHSADPLWKCAGGYPFYRWKALEMTEDICNEYCLSKGMDAFAFVHDSTDPHTAGNMAPESECRCGATAKNIDIWGGTSVPAFLLPPTESDVGGKSVDQATNGECDIEAFVSETTMVDGSTSATLMFPSIDDESYIDSIVAGCAIDHTKDDDEADAIEARKDAVTGLPMPSASICDDATQTPRAGYTSTDQVSKTTKAIFGQALSSAEAELLQSHVTMLSKTGVQYRQCYPKACGPIDQRRLWSERIRDGNGPWQESVVLRYYFLPGTDQARKDVTRKAAEAIYKSTCIKVTEFPSLSAVSKTKGYIGVGLQNGGSGTCYANMGEFPGSKINLGFCRSMDHLGSVIHEFLHAIGVNHEQKRPDGSSSYTSPTGKKHGPHLNVDWNRMSSRWKSQWTGDKNSYVGSDDQGAGDVHTGYAKYDFDSLMHYPVRSPNWKVDTIPAGMPTGQRSRIAPSDAEQVNDMYQCLLKGGATRPPVETCLDTPGTTSITLGGRKATCAQLKNYCKQASYIVDACPRTCGKCTPGASKPPPTSTHSHNPHSHNPHSHTPHRHSPTSTSCKGDGKQYRLGGKVATCAQLKPYCTHSSWGARISASCPRECGKCSGSASTTTDRRRRSYRRRRRL